MNRNRHIREAGISVWPLAAILGALGCTGPSPAEQPLEQPPIIIAHRGASGFLPEHTLAAYAMAYGQGADYIEQDLVRTRDGAFICRHDIHLEDTTDVAVRFPDRKRPDGRWYAIDFTLEEIRQLRAVERLPNRFPRETAILTVPTFEEVVLLVRGLNRSTGRRVGVYPELKEPAFHRAEGQPMEADFLVLADRLGVGNTDCPIFIQCFDPDAIRRLRGELQCRYPLVQLIADHPMMKRLLTPEGLKTVAEAAQAIGPDKKLIEQDPDLVGRAHALGLKVHPYTFRDDVVAIGYPDITAELEKFFRVYGVDGLFTDFSGTALRVRQAVFGK